MKCPICKKTKCIWIEIDKPTEKLSTQKMETIVNHNISYIEMIYRGHQGGAHSEERMYNMLTPYTDEIEKRKTKEINKI